MSENFMIAIVITFSIILFALMFIDEWKEHQACDGLGDGWTPDSIANNVCPGSKLGFVTCHKPIYEEGLLKSYDCRAVQIDPIFGGKKDELCPNANTTPPCPVSSG